MEKKGFVIEAVKYGGRSFFDHIGLMIQTFLIAIVMLFMGIIAIFAIAIPISAFLLMFTEQTMLYELQRFISDISPVLIQFFSPFVYMWINIGFMQVALDIVQHRKSTIWRMFCRPIILLRLIVASLLFGFIFVGGIILFVIPGIIWFLRGQFYMLLILDKDMGIMDSFKQSLAITKGHTWSLLGWNILAGFVSIIFLIFGWQYYALSEVYVYRYLLDEFNKRLNNNI